MIKKLFSLNYNNKIILKMLNSTLSATISTTVMMLAIIYFLHSNIPNIYLISWFILHIIFVILRLKMRTKLRLAIRTDTKKINYYLTFYTLSIVAVAFLFGISAWFAIIYDVAQTNIFIIASIVLSLLAGSIATLGTVFITFVGFSLFSIIPFMLALLYAQELIYTVLAFVLLIYLVLTIKLGYKLFSASIQSIKLEENMNLGQKIASIGIWDFDYQSNILEWTEGVHYIFETDPQTFKVSLKSFIAMVHSDDKIKVFRTYKNSLRDKKDYSIIYRIILKNKRVKYVEERCQNFFDDEGNILRSLGTLLDITSRKEIELKLEELNKDLEEKISQQVNKSREKDKQLIEQSRLAQMGEMISMIAHQWRQPLTAISATSSGLELKATLGKLDKETIIKNTRNISKYAQHLSLTINDFRDFFKPNKDKKETDFSEIIHSILNIVEVSIFNKNIHLFQELDTQERFVSYPNEIKQVILNILKNAEDVLIEEKIQEPYIKIKSYKDEGKIVLEISDNGGGIKEDIIGKVFDPYFSTKLDKNGTGLGLYMSKTIIEEHCLGKLSVSNDKNGAVFKIEFDTNKGK